MGGKIHVRAFGALAVCHGAENGSLMLAMGVWNLKPLVLALELGVISECVGILQPLRLPCELVQQQQAVTSWELVQQQ